jgi:hypothetical protein
MCDCDCELSKFRKWEQIREDYVVEMGRDLMQMGLVPFLERLVGASNLDRIFARHAGETHPSATAPATHHRTSPHLDDRGRCDCDCAVCIDIDPDGPDTCICADCSCPNGRGRPKPGNPPRGAIG